MSRAPSAQAQEALRAGRDLHRRGELAGAIDAYGRALEADATLAEAWHLKAMAEQQAGRLPEALASVQRALAAGGEQPAFLLAHGAILHDRGELEAAQEILERLVRSQPAWVPGHLALGQLLMDRGFFAPALESFRAAAAAQPPHARAWNNVGIALMALARRDEAAQAFERALQADPRYALASFNLARVHDQRDSSRALAHAEDAVRADPTLADAWLLIAEIHRRRHDPPRAMAAITAAIERAPQHAAAWDARAALVAEAGDVASAAREYAAIEQRFPGDLRAALGANLLLPRVYEGPAHLEESRARYARGLERLHESAERFRFAGVEDALVAMRWTNFYLAYQGRDDRALQQRYAAFQGRVLERNAPRLLEPRAGRRGGGRIRVGFFSHFFFNCVAGRYFASWITGLDRSRFETFVYYTNEWMANDTRAIAAASDAFRHLAGRPLAEMAAQVIADDLDVLVYPELGMHPDTLTFAALRLAPVQCAAWGHPTTTGSGAIDWFISCEAMEPANAQEHYSERLAVLPGLGTRYEMPRAPGAASRAELGLPEGRTLYLVPQSLFKIHPDNDTLLAQVLARDPDAMAVMFESSQPRLTQAFATRLTRAFAAVGLEVGSRVRFLKPNLPHADYLGVNQACDVMLDTLHWSGGNTSLDAIASGLPVVTLPGALMRGRQSQAMLRIVDAADLVATDAADYVDKAVALGRDADRRRDVASRMAAGRGRLFARDEPLRALEEFLQRAALP